METTMTKNWIPRTDTFAARLALVRHAMQWNLKEASVECGFAMNQWPSWESGRMPRDYQRVCETIAKRTGTDLIWLTFGTEPQTSDYKSPVSPTTHPRGRLTKSKGPANRSR